jgi:hypothetical protein
MGDAGQDEEQSPFAEGGVAEDGRKAEVIGNLLEGEPQTEDETHYGIGEGGLIEVAAQGATQGFDAGRVPVGEVGEGAVLDLAMLAIGFAEEKGGRGVAVGDSGDINDSYNRTTIL